MAIQMRRGLRKDFDPNKMLPGEWAVSIDASTSNQIVWMCFAAGVCKRMGTYEDFQAMVNEISADIIAQYKAEFNVILSEVQALSDEVESDKDSVATMHTQIRDEYLPQIANAYEYALLSKSYAVGGTGTRDGEDTDNAKYYSEQAKASMEKAEEIVGIGYAETSAKAGIVKPMDIHVDSTDGAMRMTATTTDTTLSNSYAGGLKVNEIGGVSKQESTTGKNLLDCSGLTEKTVSGITFTPVYDTNGSLEYININGTWDESSTSSNACMKIGTWYPASTGDYILSGSQDLGNTTYIGFDKNGSGGGYVITNLSGETSFTVGDDVEYYDVYIRIQKDLTINNVKFYPMVSVEGGEYEPYTNGASPNPDYPQEIESVVVSEIKLKDDGDNEKTITLSNPITLNSIGGVQDILKPTEKRKRFIEVVFDGSDDEVVIYTANASLPVGGYAKVSIPFNAKYVAKPSVPNLVCTHFKTVANDNVLFEEGTVTISTSKNGIVFASEKFTDADTTRAWFVENPTTVVVELAEEVIEPLPEADQIALHSLVTFDTVTHISTDSEVEPTWDVEYGTSKVGALALENANLHEVVNKRVDDINSKLDSRGYVAFGFYFNTNQGWLVSTGANYYGYKKLTLDTAIILGERALTSDEIALLKEAVQINNTCINFMTSNATLISALEGKVVSIAFTLS